MTLLKLAHAFEHANLRFLHYCTCLKQVDSDALVFQLLILFEN